MNQKKFVKKLLSVCPKTSTRKKKRKKRKRKKIEKLSWSHANLKNNFSRMHNNNFHFKISQSLMTG